MKQIQPFPLDVSIKPKEILISCILLILVILSILGLWDFYAVPPSGGDAMSFSVVIKNFQEGSWIYTNPKIAWPIGLETFFFPVGSGITFGILWVISQIIEDPMRILGIIRAFIFCLNAIAAWYVLRKLGVASTLAILGAIAFGVCDFAVGRAEGQPVYADLIAIPFLTLACARLLNYIKLKWFDYVLILLTVSVATFYYIFWSCFIILIIVVTRLVATRKISSTIPALLLLLGIISVSLLYLSPNLAFLAQNEHTPPARSPIGQVRHGLSFTDSMVPKLPVLSDMWAESRNIHLKVGVGSHGREFIGFYALIGAIIAVLTLLSQVAYATKFTDSIKAKANSFVGFLGALILITFVFALPFGAGLLFNLLVTPIFRGQDRFAVFIVFWGIAAFMLALQHLQLKRIWQLVVLSGLLTGLLYFDFVQGRKFLFFADPKPKAKFVTRVDDINDTLEEADLLHILQFPIHPYPEGGSRHNRPKLFHAVPYAVSKGKSAIFWSYGMTIHHDLFYSLQKLESQLSAGSNINETLQSITCLGYDGLYIDRLAYKDNAAIIEQRLNEQALKKVYDDREWAVYELPQHSNRGKRQDEENVQLCLQTLKN